MPWIDVDAGKLREAAASLRQTTGEVDALAEYAREADPDWNTWGIGGIPFAGLYFGVSEMVFHPALKDAAEAVEGLSARIEECAEAHDGNDAEIAAELERIGSELGGDR
ncbi:type VII secretion target [Glycomyces sp. NPDC046736]|uniref:type VII secretion target n=1 Tax=Glycomyces sp. NPDC046736 TaxID=3155615 RepID=UPI003406F244